jgi:carbon-monoxide dehydrogenase medium subunit
VKPAPFRYHRPESAEETVALLAELGDDAKVLAGGQSLIPMLSLRLTAFEHLIDIGRIESLRGVRADDGGVWVGAGTTEAAVEGDEMVAADVPLLARATPLIAHVQIRNRGTVGGSIAHADPAAEYPAVALALDAELDVLSVRGVRTIAATDFFDGLWTTTMDPDELLVGIRFPTWSGRCGSAIEEMVRRHGDYAIAGAAVAVEIDDDDRVTRCAIGLLGMGSQPLRAAVAEADAVGSAVDGIDVDALAQRAVDGLTDVPADLNGSAAYRTHVGAVMVGRALTSAIEEARRA